jgi:hypothetical protein
MKIKRIEIEPNDDGTFQVDVCPSDGENGEYMGNKCLKYSASSLEECVTKIKEAQNSKVETKKGKHKPDKTMKGFLGAVIAKPK